MIVILGDSWGMGEWGTDPKTQQPCCLTGPGIGQYCSLHGKVINLSEGGCTNTDQLGYLKELLDKFKPDHNDVFYWIVTDPVRCFANKDQLDQLLHNQPTLETAVRSALDSFLYKVNSLAHQHNIKINLIGGTCDLDTVDVSQFDRLTIKVPSWGKLLDNTYASSIFNARDMIKLGQTIKDIRPDLLDEWNLITDIAIKKENSLVRLQENNLSNDSCHPNRYGHKILRDLLYPRFKFKF